jgi:hypothetical protein
MREFKDGYIAGWRWIRGNDDLPTIPACSIQAGEMAYRVGLIRGVLDACDSPEKAAPSSEDVYIILNRASEELTFGPSKDP